MSVTKAVVVGVGNGTVVGAADGTATFEGEADGLAEGFMFEADGRGGEGGAPAQLIKRKVPSPDKACLAYGFMCFLLLFADT